MIRDTMRGVRATIRRGLRWEKFGVLRGGSWWFEADSLPAAHRVAYHPALTDIDIGLRCARDF